MLETLHLISTRSNADRLLKATEDVKAGRDLVRHDLIKDILRHPFDGPGKPEPLRQTMKGSWSRRINREHRLVYVVSGKGDAQSVTITQCRFHD